ncbi:MAG TPA: methionyl-tRNA formyltransferase [Vicinamibacterales bacterium]|nr:methionyl-tRNA formyltransferase [Vicinamibacterales bacterium]
MLRIVFFGTPQFAVPTLERLTVSGHQVTGVVTQPDRARGRGQRIVPAPVKDFAVTHGIPLMQPERLRDPSVEATLRSWEPDLGVVAAYGRIIPAHLLTVPSHGMINVHASLLPKYRGAAPVQRAVIAGETETGVTIMRVAEALDTGDMFARATRPIGPDERSETIERDLAERGARLLVEVVDAIAAGTAHAEPQDHTRSTYAPRLTREEGLIDWTLPAADIHNRVRGLSPWPHAYSFLDGHRLIVTTTEPAGDRTDAPPGTIVNVLSDRLLVATGDGRQIAVREVQPEGRRSMAIRDYLAGHPIAAGVRFDNR